VRICDDSLEPVYDLLGLLPGGFLIHKIVHRLGRTMYETTPLPLDDTDAVEQTPVPMTMLDREAETTLSDMMADLLSRSMYDSPDQSRAEMHRLLLRALVPDEARILAALSDGSRYALIHIAEPGLGGSQKLVLEHACSVGRAAGVAAPERTAVYVGRLIKLGLVEVCDEEPTLRDEYQILLTEPMVRAAVDTATKRPLPARILKRTLSISALGRELWEAAR
jgi:hypothetical protein